MAEETPKKQGKTIKLKAKTVERLDKFRHKGQSYDGIITEMIDHFENEAREEK